MSTHDFLFLLVFKTVILSVAAVVVWLFMQLLRCRAPKIHRTAWGVVLLLGILGAGLPVSIPIAETPGDMEIPASNTLVQTAPIAEPVKAIWPEITIPADKWPEPGTENPVINLNAVYHPTTNRIEIIHDAKKPISIGDICAVVVVCWFAGIAAFLLWRFVLYLLLLRQLRTATEATGDAADQWNSLRNKQRLPLLLTDHLGPGLVWRPSGSAVLVPRDLWEETTPEIREGILRHELAHYRNGDMFRSGLARLLTLVHWFNPLAWFALKKMDEATEWACDLAAFGTMPDGTLRFAQSMVAVHEAAPTVLLNRYAFGGGKVSDRAKKLQEFITQPKESAMKRIFISTLLTVCLLFGTLQIRFVATAAEKPSNEPAATETISPPYSLKIHDAITLKIESDKVEENNAKQINGKHIVAPDGYITLGVLGRVYVKDLTLSETEEAIRFHLKKPLSGDSFTIYASISQNNKNQTNVNSSSPGIQVELTDMDGKPCMTGYVRTYPNPRPKDWPGDQPQNFDLTDGKCFVPLSNFDKQKSFKMVLYADGFTPYEMRWPDTAKGKLPERFLFKMPERAAEPIGSRIVDADGKPLEGASVEFGVSLQGRQKYPDGMISSYAQWIKTDADGRWIYKVLPKEQLDQKFDMTVDHPDYPSFSIRTGQTFKDYQAKDADGKFSKTVTIPRGLTLKGKIVDEQGDPVEGVLVITDVAKRDDRGKSARRRSDANGEFLFNNCSSKGSLGQVYVGVAPKHFAPELVAIPEVTETMEPLKIVLKHGKRLVIKTIDKDGKPIEGLSIVPRQWRRNWMNNSLYKFFDNDFKDVDRALTDKDGMFVWNDAPEDPFDFEITVWDKKLNYQNIKRNSGDLKYGDEENVFTFLPLFEIVGNVVDAETGKPIPSFSVSEWFVFKNGSGLVREFGTQSGKDGKFTRKVGQRFGELKQYFLRVDADGYEGLQSEDLISKTGDTTLEFKMKKATGKFAQNLSGTVLQPDGKPAAGTTIGFSTSTYRIQMKGTGIVGNEQQQARADKEGKFSINRNNSGIGDQDYQFIFIHETGTLRMKKEEFEKHSGPITLQPWGRIEGRVLSGSKPVPNAPIWYSIHEGREAFDEKKAVISIANYDLKCDEKGNFVIDRAYPGKTEVGRMAILYGGKSWAPFLVQTVDVKPGKTIKLQLGGGGSTVKGLIMIPKENTPKPVDWQFARVEAKPAEPDLIALPALSDEAHKLRAEIVMAIPELNKPYYIGGEETMKLINRYLETPEGKAKVEQNQAAYESLKRYMDIAVKFDGKRFGSDRKRIVSTVDKKGQFQLDDLTPGNWTLEATLEFPNVPGQWYDFADVWRKKMEITVPELPADQKNEPLEISPIPLGYDKADHKGPRQ